jgi:hypothetical protein
VRLGRRPIEQSPAYALPCQRPIAVPRPLPCHWPLPTFTAGAKIRPTRAPCCRDQPGPINTLFPLPLKAVGVVFFKLLPIHVHELKFLSTLLSKATSRAPTSPIDHSSTPTAGEPFSTPESTSPPSLTPPSSERYPPTGFPSIQPLSHTSSGSMLL